MSEQNTYYDKLTGRIVTVFTGPCVEENDSLHPDCNRLSGVLDWQTQYVDLTDPDSPTPTERPASPVTRTDLTLLDVPTGSKLWVNGESYDAEGTVELEFPLPGTYSLRVECFPFLDWVGEVVV